MIIGTYRLHTFYFSDHDHDVVDDYSSFKSILFDLQQLDL